MKKVLLVVLTSLLFSLTYSQERTSKPNPEIGDQILGQLTSSTGWMLNPDEEWVSLENTIPIHLASEYSSLLDYEKKGLGTDNFLSYQLRKLTYKGTEYFILIKHFRDGYYKYESIKEDWRELESFNAYVFTTEEYEKLHSIQDATINQIEISIIDMVNIKWKEENEAYELIPTKIEWDKPEDKKSTLIFHIAPYKEKNIVQFQVYTSYSKYKIIGGIITEHKAKGGEYSWSTKQVYLTDELFDHCYYETDYANFTNFLPLN